VTRVRQSLYDYCKALGDDTLLREWDAENNGEETPESITYGSRRKVRWRCEKGHEWQAAVYSRTGGSRCPYCTGKRVESGKSDLASQYPEIAAQWHPTKNAGLPAPEEISPWSHRKVVWLCEKGHEWSAEVKARTQGSGCPVCSNRGTVSGCNDLGTTHPELASQWDEEKNGQLRPGDVVAGSHRRVFWKCERGHSWLAAVSSRVRGSGCPYCAGKRTVPGENDLAAAFPELAAQWDSEKNGKLRPEQVSPGSNRKVYWRCEKGHVYQAEISARTAHGSGCPYCSGRRVLAGFNDLATAEPRLARQWHPTLNGTLSPAEVTRCSSKKVWWQCASGHAWQAAVYSRSTGRKCGCPYCAGRYFFLKEKVSKRTSTRLQASGNPGFAHGNYTASLIGRTVSCAVAGKAVKPLLGPKGKYG